MDKARFLAWVTQPEVELRESQPFFLPQAYWISPGNTDHKQISSDGAACSEEMLGYLSRVHISQGKTNISHLLWRSKRLWSLKASWNGLAPKLQSCPDNLLLCSALQGIIVLAMKANLGLNSSKRQLRCTTLGNPPSEGTTHYCTSTTPRSHSRELAAFHITKIAFFCLSIPLCFSLHIFWDFLIHFVFVKTAVSLPEFNINSSFFLCFLTMASNSNPVGTMVNTLPYLAFLPGMVPMFPGFFLYKYLHKALFLLPFG